MLINHKSLLIIYYVFSMHAGNKIEILTSEKYFLIRHGMLWPNCFDSNKNKYETHCL